MPSSSKKILLMFPGQGSQYSGMGKDWYDNFHKAKLAFEEACDNTGLDLRKLCFEGSEEDLKKTEITQPAILTTTIAIYRVLESEGVLSGYNSLFAGHSLGEYSALVAAGAVGLGDAAKIVRMRGRFMQEAVPQGLGAMAALVFKPKTQGSDLAEALCQEVSRTLKKTLSVANYNSPEQIVIAGTSEAVKAACELAVTDKYGARRTVELPVSAPFHCELMKPAAERLSAELDNVTWNSSEGQKYVANVDATIHDLTDARSVLPSRLTRQITSPVRWVASLESALKHAYLEAVEIGPGRVLAGLAKRVSLGELEFAKIQNVDRWEEFKNAGAKL
jgi:[acyl-carrier-protein] S-malonyltransferase